MSALKDIPRVKAGTSAASGKKSLTEVDQERLYLATRAKDLLGYERLSADVTGTRVIGTREGKLTQALLQMDFTVLDSATVIDYQLDEVTRRNREHIADHLWDWCVGYYVPACWQRTKLNEYSQPIPEFALDKAIKIKEKFPEVDFYIQHLNDPKADPFLIATYDREVYYIEAWAEPGFEAQL
jgi:hypothetical protein